VPEVSDIEIVIVREEEVFNMKEYVKTVAVGIFGVVAGAGIATAICGAAVLIAVLAYITMIHYGFVAGITVALFMGGFAVGSAVFALESFVFKDGED